MYELTNEHMKKKFLKKEFLKLRVCGQFNLGFMICTLYKNDLFILDEHACDERYNLEDLTSSLKAEA